MFPFRALSPRVEVWGTSMLGVLQAVRDLGVSPRELDGLLQLHRLPQPEPEGWYAQSDYLALLETLGRRHGMAWLRGLGRQVPRTSMFPPEIRSLERALRTLDVAYHMNHRGGPIGGYLYEGQGHFAGRIHCDTPYGCDFDLGILQGLVDRFHSTGDAQIIHLLEPGCRAKGDPTCVYRLEWSDPG